VHQGVFSPPETGGTGGIIPPFLLLQNFLDFEKNSTGFKKFLGFSDDLMFSD